jgi:phosphoribosyl 1,2-cyclic phosphodiesterase
MTEPSMSVRFWGVRGSIPTPGATTTGYGGNTSCVEIRCGDGTLIFDAGSGLRLLGEAMKREARLADIDIFLSHCHIDHLIGLPFFAPMLHDGGHIRLWAGNLQPRCGVKDAVDRLMSFPLFPIEIEMLKGRIEFHDFCAGDRLELRAGVTLQTAPLRHPGGATGYRLDYAGRSLAFLTDTECGGASVDADIAVLAKDVDLMIIDATYTDAEMPAHEGWGHSSWQQGVRLADAAGAKRLCLFHHDPDHDDHFMDAVASAAAKARPGTIVAREGLCIDL